MASQDRCLSGKINMASKIVEEETKHYLFQTPMSAKIWDNRPQRTRQNLLIVFNKRTLLQSTALMNGVKPKPAKPTP